MNAEFLKELRQTTNDAIANGEAEQRRKKAERDRVVEERRKIQEAKAKLIVQEIPNQCREAATNGQRQAQVMKLEYGDYETHNGFYNSLESTQLKYKARVVYDACVEMGFRVTLDFDHDGVGVNSWFMMTVHW